MKVWRENNMKVFSWENKEIKIVLDAIEFDDYYISDEPEGERIYKEYTSSELTEALKKAIELIEKGWEDVNLTFRTDTDTVRFSFGIQNLDVCALLWAQVWIDNSKIAGDCCDKLRKIREILRQEG